jgi:signal transduction histidine kinase
MTLAAAAADYSKQPDSTGKRGGGSTSSGHGSAVLVVEDEPAVAEAIAQVLSAEGYTVVTACDGQQAFERLQGQSIDLIVLDLRMPIMDGWTFRKNQRSDPRYSHIPVIAVSADSSPQAEAIDASQYLPKPFNAEQLTMAVERVLLREGRRQLDDQLKEARLLTTLGTIAATVGHEINNPLTYVLGNIEALERLVLVVEPDPTAEATSSPEVTDLLREARLGAERIRDMVSDLRRLSATSPVRMSLVDVRSMVRTSVAMAWHEIRHRARLVSTLNPVPTVLGDEVRLGQVVLNLLINAAQSMPTGGYESNQVRVSTFSSGDEVVIEVSDTGSGISQELQARVFDPFFTTKGRAKGTGIGLTVARSIVQEHDGRIELTSRPGVGTTFRVFLPAHAPAAQSGPAEDDALAGGADEGEADEDLAGPAGPRRVLIVDDDALVLTSMVRMLSPDYTVQSTSNPREALELVASGPAFDAIVCDVMMPQMTGMQLAAQLDRVQPGTSSRMVFVTGAVLDPDVHAFRQSSDNIWLEKPFLRESLLDAVRETIKRHGGATTSPLH